MRWVRDFLRRLLGIHAYTPGEHPRSLVRTPTWYGTRGNGHGPFLDIAWSPAIEALAREHRFIRQRITDIERRKCRREIS